MEYISILGFIVALIGFVFYRSYKIEEQKKELFLKKCKSLVGNPPQASLRINYVPSVEKKKRHISLHNVKEDGPDAYSDNFYIDDITWSNLDMDAVYDRMNYCLTKEGAAFLDEILHNQLCSQERLEALDEAISLSDDNIENMQRFLAEYRHTRIRRSSKANPSQEKNWRPISKKNASKEIALNLLYILAVGLIAVLPAVGVVAIIAVCAYMIVTYFQKKVEVEEYIRLIEELANIYRTVGGLEQLECFNEMNSCFESYEKTQQNSLHNSRTQLSFITKKSLWIGDSTAAGSGIVGAMMVYIKMLFHVDLISLYLLDDRLDEASVAARIMGRFLGFVDASLSLALWRKSLGQWTKPVICSQVEQDVISTAEPIINQAIEPKVKPTAEPITNQAIEPKVKPTAEPITNQTIDSNRINIVEATHPLVDNAVPSSIAVDKKGVLITGSNASGKSTFLKNTALQLILAQTVNTVMAKEVRMPFCHVITAMAVSDDILMGDSYYMAEIKSLKRIMSTDNPETIASSINLTANMQTDNISTVDIQRADIPTVCFVDEVLRGTNTIERIAASTAILKNLQSEQTKVFCATHDIELTHLLEEDFDNYHFTEELVEGDIHFSYELKQGRAESRNAIYLLKAMGYSDEIIEKARSLASNFETSGSWKV